MFHSDFSHLEVGDSRTKTCSKCGQLKPVDQFYKDKRHPDGLFSSCKSCHRLTVNIPRQTPEAKVKLQAYHRTTKAKATRKRYSQTSKGKVANYRCVQRHVKKHPRRARCHWRFSKAIKRGKITRPRICSLCWLQNGTIEGHHPDYSNPFEIIWLCRKCHREIAA